MFEVNVKEIVPPGKFQPDTCFQVKGSSNDISSPGIQGLNLRAHFRHKCKDGFFMLITARVNGIVAKQPIKL